MSENIKINELCYSTLSSSEPNSFETYIKNGGYDALESYIKPYE